MLPLASAVNLRDLGGLPTPGGRVRHGMVLRGASPQFLSEADAGTLGAAVRLVLDLRFDEEAVREGHGHLTGPRIVNIPIVGAGGADVEMEVLAGDLNEPDAPDDAAREHLSAHYISYVKLNPGAFVRAFREMASDGLPVLVHCAAGKDRTGVLVGLLLSLLGVPDYEIVADYARTAENLPDIVAHLAAAESYAAMMASRDLDDPFAQSPPATMRRLLAWLRAQGGTAHVLTGAGLEPDALDTLRARLVEPA
ncbi:tyrosine-protein phosphatase [Jatrophihabitans fulvus]